ncbi:MAG: phage holin family protein [Patescibacteria group bacterium]
MKKLLRSFVLSLIALKIVSGLTGAVFFDQGAKSLILAALALTGFEYLLKPIANLLLLPINILTLGLLRWVINVVGLYLATAITPGFYLESFTFPGLTWQGIVLPKISFSLLVSYIIISFLINLIITIAKWLLKK